MLTVGKLKKLLVSCPDDMKVIVLDGVIGASFTTDDMHKANKATLNTGYEVFTTVCVTVAKQAAEAYRKKKEREKQNDC